MIDAAENGEIDKVNDLLTSGVPIDHQEKGYKVSDVLRAVSGVDGVDDVDGVGGVDFFLS